MNLVWKLLRQHISVPQFIGFFFANLFGMLIVLLGYQFYKDVKPVLTADDSFMKSDYVIVEKVIGTGSTLSGRSNAFSPSEVTDMQQEGFVKKIGVFTSTQYQTTAHMGIARLLRVLGLINRATTWCRSFFHAAISLCITSALPRAGSCRK